MNKRLLIIGLVWPEPNSSAAGCRMLQLIHFFLNEGFDITFCTACAKSDNAADLTDIGVRGLVITLNDSSFDETIKWLMPHAVLFDRFLTEEQFGWRVAASCPEAIRILDTEDLHFLRKARQEAIKVFNDVDKANLQSAQAKREIASIFRSDLSLIISRIELDILINQFKIDDSLLLYLPFFITPITKVKQSTLPSFEDRKDFVTIGNFKHPPNVDAILYLKHTIWPLIFKRLPKTKMHVYGAYPTQQALELQDAKIGFFVHGKAENVQDIMVKARICLAPLRFGAGLKGKVFDAFKNGTPCVMSRIGAEGIFPETRTFSFIVDEPDAFAQSAVDFYDSREQWEEAQEIGYSILNTDFNEIDHKTRLKSKLAILERDLSMFRKNNFIGQMLQYHTMQSTKYMSRWIEAKNQYRS